MMALHPFGTKRGRPKPTPVPPPSITSFSPTRGPEHVTIIGSNFAGASAVKFNGTTSTYTVVSDTQITADFPMGATTGKITVTTANGTGTSATDYTIGNQYYAASAAAGAGNGSTINDPELINSFWAAQAVPGAVLWCKSGTYQGANSMITPPATVHGNSTDKIYIKAITEGGVDIDGQDARQFVVYLKSGNSYIEITGVNAHNGAWNVFALEQVNHCNLKRCVGWDAAIDHNVVVFAINYSTDCLIEDCAGFGYGRKSVISYSNNGPNTIRRFWSRFEGCTNVGPKIGLSPSYTAYNTTMENCIATWDQTAMTASYNLQSDGLDYTGYTKLQCAAKGGTASADFQPCAFTGSSVEQPYAPLFQDTNPGLGSTATYSKIYGCLVYMKAGESFQSGTPLVSFLSTDQVDLKDCVAVIPAGSFAGHKPFSLSAGYLHQGLAATNLTSLIGGGSASTYHADWTKTNVVEAATPAALYTGPSESLYSTFQGAQLRYRYTNGVLTQTALWPWPMNQRIIDATTTANADGHGHPVANVDSDRQAIFGHSPDEP